MSRLSDIGGRATELRFEVTDETYNCEPHALDYAPPSYDVWVGGDPAVVPGRCRRKGRRAVR